MKISFKKWAMRLALSGLCLIMVLVILLLNPSLLYAHKTSVGNCEVYHNAALDKMLVQRLNEADKIIKLSELYDASLHYDICLSDGSYYPSIVKMIFREPIGSTFYNKIVFWGEINCKENYAFDGSHQWNLSQLIAHTETHCLQFNKLGLFKSNPVANYPNWKWEGYAEYVSRNTTENNNLSLKIDNLLQQEKSEEHDWIRFEDGTGSSNSFYKKQLLVQYCMDIKNMSFEDLLNDKMLEEGRREEMMNWYRNHMN